MSKELITIDKLSERISIPIWSIRKMIRENKLRAYKIGRSYLLDPEEVISTIKEKHCVH